MAARLTTELLANLPRTGATDPIEYYRRPFVGWLFRERINRGLDLLDDAHFDRALEVGYGAGAVLLALNPLVNELHGIDLDADPVPVRAALARRGAEAALKRGSVTELPYPDAHFDLVVSFSVFEHLRDYARALAEVERVLRPGGRFLLGMPSVNRLMEVGFRLIGFRGIDDHHVTTPLQVRNRLEEAGLRLERQTGLDLPAASPLGLRVYHHFLLRRSA